MGEQTIIARDNIIHSVVDFLSNIREGQERFNGITLWTEDNFVKEIISTKDFKDMLCAELDNHNLRFFGKEVRTLSKEPTEDEDVFEVNIQQWKLKILLNRFLAKVSAAIGTLVDDEYILDWQQQTEWNIGRGIHPSYNYGVDVENYIVIKDNEQETDIRYLNEHVSSFHAKIMFSDNQYYFKTEEGGLNNTRIKHKNARDWYTLRTDIAVPLLDGDQIKLGSINHFVLLRFKLS